MVYSGTVEYRIAGAMSVMKRKVVKVLLSALILLLGVQLTGLNCLGEWDELLIVSEHQLQSQIDTGATQDNLLGEDACPCHLAFVSGSRISYEASLPIALMIPGTLDSNLSASPSLPFRPPVSL